MCFFSMFFSEKNPMLMPIRDMEAMLVMLEKIAQRHLLKPEQKLEL